MKSMISIRKHRDGDELVQTLTEQLPVGVCVMQDGKFCYVNKTFPIAIGYTVDELIGMDSLQIVVPEDKEIVKENTTKMLKGQIFAPYQFRVIRKDGSIVWVMATVKSIGYHGKPAILGNYMEVTERRRMVDALQENEEKFRLLAENSVMGTFVLQDSKMIYVSPSFAKVFGYRPEEIINAMSPSDFIHPDDKNLVMQRLADRYTGKATDNHISLRGVKKDGSTIYIEGSSVLTEYRGKPAVMGTFVDISERKQAEEALRKSEERYRQLAENAGEAIFVVQDGMVKFINPKGEQLSGYSLEELASAPFVKFIYRDDVNMVLDRYGKRLKGEPVPQIYDFRIMRKDGDIRWGALSAVSISWEDRPAVLCFMSDITERKRAEEALRQSEERYRTILEDMEDAYFEVDLGGHLTFVNNSVCRDLGYAREELMGKSYKAFTVEDDIDSVFRVFNEVYRTGMPNKGFPWKTVRKDGTHGFAETSISLLRNNSGEVIGFRGVGRDITERKRAEAALRQGEENYRVLFDSSVIGSVVLDAETMKIVMCNQAALKMFGFSSAEEAFQAQPFDFLPSEERERYLEIAKTAVFEQNSHEGYQLRVLRKDGREIWINATAAKIMHEGRVAALISFTDISEQKRQREQLMMTDRLASLGELASGAAHELNNPLTSIIGFSQLLVEREVPDDMREDLRLINSEAQRAANVTRNLLTFARKHPPMKEPNQVTNIIEDVLRLRVYDHKARGIEIERQFTPNLPEVMVDYFQMQQVFMNIIINAEYFMANAHNRGTLTIATKEQDDSVMISFTDDGPGIAPENLGRIFDPFFTTKEAGQGTGLGLSICHGIVTEHGGQIYARSQLGKGTTIVVQLPVSGERRS
jgi:two-component system NtrC family sensor kinase